MIKIAICDDEELYLGKMKMMIEQLLIYHQVESFQIDTYRSGVALCKEILLLNQYKIIFLDINMKRMDGIKTAEYIRKVNREVFLVFVTAYVDYAVAGYKVEAIRFILKDMIHKMLPECIETVLQRIQYQDRRIGYTFTEGYIELSIDKISYIENRRHMQTFYISGTCPIQYHIYSKLDDIEADLTDYGFIRIHKSYLVNIRFVVDVGNYKVKLKNGDWLPVPREKFRAVKERYYEMIGEL